MKITTIKVPAHWSTADTADIARELVGLIIEKRNMAEDSTVNVHGVRVPAVYGATWASVARSKFIRKAGWVMEVKWS